MMISDPSPQPQPQPWNVLQRFARPRPPVECCELCGLALDSDHPHLWESAARRLRCCCQACSILFSRRQDARYRRVPHRVERLTDFQLSDAQWEELRLPIDLAFFQRVAPDRILAFYPGPAGATESLLSLDAWERLADQNPVLTTLEPEVEALLVNRLRESGAESPACFLVSIDECYKLVGLIRTHWRGLSGGAAVWDEIRRFFAELQRCAPATGGRAPTSEGDAAHAGPEL